VGFESRSEKKIYGAHGKSLRTLRSSIGILKSSSAFALSSESTEIRYFVLDSPTLS
jgi:hypothetical protein